MASAVPPAPPDVDDSAGFTLRMASSAADHAAFARLAREYHEYLHVDLGCQGIDEELASLPGCYAPPGGFILLAAANGSGEPVGCVAVRPLSANASAAATLQQHEQQAACQPGLQPLQLEAACELKRLWVATDLHDSGLGQALVSKAVDRARAAGYKRMLLETLASLPAAVKLYERMGFERREAPYTHTPLPDVLQFELAL